MHGRRAEGSEAETAPAAAGRDPLRAGASVALSAGFVAIAILAGLAGLAVVATPVWAKIALLAAILVPAGCFGLLALRRRNTSASEAVPGGESQLLRHAADAVDEPRAVLGPGGEIAHANAAFIALFKKSAGLGSDPVAGVFGGDAEQVRRFVKLCADAKVGAAGQADFPLPAQQGGAGIRRVYATPGPEHPGPTVPPPPGVGAGAPQRFGLGEFGGGEARGVRGNRRELGSRGGGGFGPRGASQPGRGGQSGRGSR